jgi:nicotinate phosphoribosyltransferase
MCISFEIGRNFTNNAGPKPMNIVIKVTGALPKLDLWTTLVKLSDEPVKHTGNETAIALVKAVLQID